MRKSPRMDLLAALWLTCSLLVSCAEGTREQSVVELYAMSDGGNIIVLEVKNVSGAELSFYPDTLEPPLLVLHLVAKGGSELKALWPTGRTWYEKVHLKPGESHKTRIDLARWFPDIDEASQATCLMLNWTTFLKMDQWKDANRFSGTVFLGC